MAVFVDELIDWGDWGDWVEGEARRYGTKWCHMTADTPEELHAFAQRLGLRRQWCSDYTQPHSRQLHYDLTPGKRALAVRLGAKQIEIWKVKDGQEGRQEEGKAGGSKEGTGCVQRTLFENEGDG